MIIIKTAVVLIAYNRPQYLRKVLYSISKAHIIEKFDFFFNVDYDKTTISRNLYLIESFMKKVNRNILAETIKVNNSPLGCGLNHKDAIDRVFNFGYETVICIEDDVMISSDALEFFNQIIKKPDCMIACGFRNHHNFAGYNADQKHDEVCFSERFSPWGWSLSRDSWYTMSKHIQWNHTWDIQVSRYVKKENKLCFHPRKSRTQNIGAIGLHMAKKYPDKSASRLIQSPPSNVLKESFPKGLKYFVIGPCDSKKGERNEN